jgi:Zn-dependent protease
MINKREIAALIISSIIIAFSITLVKDFNVFFLVLLAVFILISVNVIIKKFMAYLLESEIEIKIWEIRRWGFKTSQYWKKAFPLGVFMPLVMRVLLFSFNGFTWMASLVFDVKAKAYHAAKRHGMYSFSEMTEEHIGKIAAAGIFANLFLAVLFYLIGGDFGTLFAKLNIWFVFFNMIPLSDLDGNKIFFGNIILWSFLAVITLIGLAATFLLV